MMNKENVLAVADAIEKHSIPDLGFNMFDYYITDPALWDTRDMSGHNCGTTACIAGWAVAVSQPSLDAVRDFFEEGREYLSLSMLDAEKLFLCNARKSTKPDQAVRVLRHLAETGEVDWSVA